MYDANELECQIFKLELHKLTIDYIRCKNEVLKKMIFTDILLLMTAIRSLP